MWHAHKLECLGAMNISQLKRLRVLELHFRTHRGFHVQLSGVIHSLSSDTALEEVNISSILMSVGLHGNSFWVRSMSGRS